MFTKIKYYSKYRISPFNSNIKWTIKNLFIYFKVVSKMRPWDSDYILIMMKFQLERLCETIDKYGIEIDEYRLPKVEKMKRALKLLNNIIEDNYADRCGYIERASKLYLDKKTHEIKWELQPGYENYDEAKVFRDADELRVKEWDELFDLLKYNMSGWWD